MAKLSAKQKLFVDEYLIDLNATQAAIRSGYSAKTAYSIGERLLRHVEVKAAVDARLVQLQSARIASVDEIMQHLTAVLRGEISEQVPLLCGDGCQQLVGKQVSEKDRLKAAELLGKRYGVFTDKLKVDGAVPVVICEDLQDDEQNLA